MLVSLFLGLSCAVPMEYSGILTYQASPVNKRGIAEDGFGILYDPVEPNAVVMEAVEDVAVEEVIASPPPEVEGDEPPEVPADLLEGVEGPVEGQVEGEPGAEEAVVEDTRTGRPVTRYTLTNSNGLMVQVINYGVTITSIVVPDRNGVFDDIALGFDEFQAYVDNGSYYLGSTVGRIAQVVSRARFQMDGRMYELPADEKGVHKHGGPQGFAKVIWNSRISGEYVVFTHLSGDGEDGYPGNLLVTIKMTLGDDNALRTTINATCDRETPVNIANHTCFNLAGHMWGPTEIGNHVVVLNADKWLCTDEDHVPTGEIKHVGCTLLDLRVHRVLSRLIPLLPLGGFDHTYVVNGARHDGLRFVGRLLHPKSGRVLEVFSDQPAAHFYTGKDLGYQPPEPELDADADGADVVASLDNQVGSEADATAVVPELLPPEPEPEMEPEAEAADGDPPAAEVDDNDALPVNIEELEGLAELPDEGPKMPEMLGKGGALYEKYGCFSLMTQGYTDAVNKRDFPCVMLRPGETYTHTSVLRFAVCVKSRKYAAEALANSPPTPVPSVASVASEASRRSGDSRSSPRDEGPEGDAPPPDEGVEGAEEIPVEEVEPVAVEVE